jgi:outer membrane lipoprotein SlyB
MLKPRYVAATALAIACGAIPLAQSAPAPAPASSYYVKVAYGDLGRVVAIDVVRRDSRPSGAGAVLGGVLGGVLGHQVGSGRGNTAATVAGAVGGAVVGNELEERRHEEQRYRISVRFRDGTESTFEQSSLNGIRVGDRVRTDGDHLVRD